MLLWSDTSAYQTPLKKSNAYTARIFHVYDMYMRLPSMLLRTLETNRFNGLNVRGAGFN